MKYLVTIYANSKNAAETYSLELCTNQDLKQSFHEPAQLKFTEKEGQIFIIDKYEHDAFPTFQVSIGKLKCSRGSR
jgi:hypothetical protein